MPNCYASGLDWLGPKVDNGQAALFAVAGNALLGVDTSVSSLNSLISGLNPLDIDIDLTNAGTLSNPFDIGPAPTPNVVDYVKPLLDYTANITIPTFNKTAQDPGTFNKVAPVIDPGERPGALNAEDPGDAPTVGVYPFPADPDTDIPAVPALEPIIIPNFPALNLPTFDAAEPGDLSEASFGVFSWAEGTYTPEVQAEVVTQIKAILGGSTGIPDRIWDMIEERMRKKFRDISRQAREEAEDYWASRGHMLTNGALRKRVKEAGDLEREGVSELIRELAIQDSRIYVERLNNAIAQGISLESNLIGLYNAQQARSLDAAKTVFDIGLRVADYHLNVYNTRMQVYQIKAQVFQIVMQGELARLEETRLRIEAEKLKGQLNLQTLEAYKAQLQGITATYEVFKYQVEAVAVKYDADKTRVMAFGEEVKAYGAKISAWEAAWKGYGESVKAEVGKVDAYSAEASAFNSKVQAYSTGVNADKAEHDAYIASEQLKIDRMGAGVQKLGADVDAESSRVKAAVDVQTLDMRGYEAEATAEQARVASDVNRLQVLIQNANMRMQAQVQETQMKIQEAQNKLTVQSNGLNAILQANAQLASSALAALNYAMTLEGNISASASCSDIYNN